MQRGEPGWTWDITNPGSLTASISADLVARRSELGDTDLDRPEQRICLRRWQDMSVHASTLPRERDR